jgi:hypothetical protein
MKTNDARCTPEIKVTIAMEKPAFNKKPDLNAKFEIWLFTVLQLGHLGM